MYRSTRDSLVNVAPLRAGLATSSIDERTPDLRTNKLKQVRELWELCLFAHGVRSCCVEHWIYVALVENFKITTAQHAEEPGALSVRYPEPNKRLHPTCEDARG